MATLRLVLILVIIQSSLVLTTKLLQDSSEKHVKQKHDLSHRLFKRQVECNEGEYYAKDFCCKRCPKGTHAASDCTEPQGKPVCKECSEGVDFMDEENGYPMCQRCQNCESDAGQEVLHPCTITQNTVCKCKEGFYCSGENCNRCQQCTVCEHGNAKDCTSTNNTVCKDSSARTHTILWAVLGVIAIAFAALITFFVWKKCCSNTVNTGIPEPSKPLIPPKTCPSHLENIKLDSHLFKIAGLMGHESVQKLVEKHLSPVDREETRLNKQSNAREEKCELLNRWYNANGRQGAFKMLIDNCTKVEAEKIIELVQKENTEPVAENII